MWYGSLGSNQSRNHRYQGPLHTSPAIMSHRWSPNLYPIQHSHLSHSLRCAIGQIRTSSHQLEIETGRFRGIPADNRICRICHLEPETELHYICHCTVYYEIRGRFHCLFKEGFGPLSRVMSYEDQRCLGLYLLELHRHIDTLLRRARES